ncbi:MAG: ATP-binding protein, partial [Sinobacteraceae bacterium]|nr:ATP-binding protein [Nevskiaceae bacterium]
DGKPYIPPSALPDPRLARVQSGLEAIIFDSQGRVAWHSSNLSGPLPKIKAPHVGDSLLKETDKQFVFSLGIRWHRGNGKAPRYTIALLTDKTTYEAQLNTFRRSLWLALGVAGATLVLLQFVLLRWSLAPLRRLAREVRDIETGARQEIEGTYPAELMAVAGNLNAVIRTARSYLSRSRNALGDLAHSLKTPLAILRGIAEAPDMSRELAQQIDNPVTRMEHIVQYQLRRAAAAGHQALSQPVAVEPVAGKVLAALAKVHADRQLNLRNQVDPAMRLRADEGDLYEVIGNLVDNACKWAANTVRVAAEKNDGKIGIVIEDDGPGFPPDADSLMARGIRADSRTPGQGIGLATVADVLSTAGGSIELSRSSLLGGARVLVYWPG